MDIRQLKELWLSLKLLKSNLLFQPLKETLIPNNNHKANQNNGSKGTSGNNPAYQKAQDNCGNQLNPNNPNYQGKK